MNNETLFITKNAPFAKLTRVNQSNGEPLVLTGYSSYMVLQKYVGDDTKFTISGIIETPSSGIIKYSIASDATPLLPSGLMHYSMYLQPPGNVDKMLLEFGVAKVIGAA